MRVQFRGNEANATVTMHPFAQTGTHFARTYRTTASHYTWTNIRDRVKWKSFLPKFLRSSPAHGHATA